MPSPRYLTKTRFKLAVECPTKLFYTKKDAYKDTKNEDSFLAMLADGGFQVGELAKLMFPTGVEIKSKISEDAEKETLKHLTQDEVVLFEPAIRFQNLLVRIDVLIKRGHSFELIEVKSKSYDPNLPKIVGSNGGILSKMLPYIQDVAFQKYVLQNAFSFPDTRITTYLLMPDKSKQATVDGMNQLFKVDRSSGSPMISVDPRARSGGCGAPILARVNVDPYVEMVLNNPIKYPGGEDQLPVLAARWAAAYETNTRITPPLGGQCAKCEFRGAPGDALKSGFHECWGLAAKLTERDIANGTVLDIYNFKRKSELIDLGKYKLTQVTADDLQRKGQKSKKTQDRNGLTIQERQIMQVTSIPKEDDKGGFYLDESLLRAEKDKWKFPYHFIDFETAMVALPFYKGMRPYEQIAFQFSHHTMSADGRVQHVDQFLLAEPGKFPNYEFIRALRRSLKGDDGTVFMWHHHENTILTAIVTQLKEDATPQSDKDELIAFSESLIKGGSRAMVDLRVLSNNAYFHPDTKGSSSIKKVLPAVLKTSEFIRKKYGQPIYGGAEGIKSTNYKDYIWWRQESGNVVDPYKLLKDAARDMLGEDADDLTDDEADDVEIAEGGAAAAAYSRLQFEHLNDNSRERIKNALLRYCELDTLAMVMILEAWLAVLAQHAEATITVV